MNPHDYHLDRPGPRSRTPQQRPELRAFVLSGIGHEPDIMKHAVPPEVKDRSITYINYQDCKDADAVMERLKKRAEIVGQPDLLIGWSLGGKLAARAVAEHVLEPKLLVMIGSSYKRADDTGIRAVDPDFTETYAQRPAEARKRFAAAMVKGDSNRAAILRQLEQDTAHHADWLRWLQAPPAQPADLAFSNPPPTLVIMGANDTIAPAYHGDLFKEKIPDAEVKVIPNCGHIPHLHDSAQIKRLIGDKLQELGLASKGKALSA